MTDFVNLKIKSDQYFRYVHKNKLYVRIFIKLSAVYEYPRVTAVLGSPGGRLVALANRAWF
jgi:hypothetical protein